MQMCNSIAHLHDYRTERVGLSNSECGIIMQVSITVNVHQVPQGQDAQTIGHALSSVVSGLVGGTTRVIVNDRDHGRQWDRWNVLREMNRGITLPGQSPEFEDTDGQISLFRERR